MKTIDLGTSVRALEKAARDFASADDMGIERKQATCARLDAAAVDFVAALVFSQAMEATAERLSEGLAADNSRAADAISVLFDAGRCLDSYGLRRDRWERV